MLNVQYRGHAAVCTPPIRDCAALALACRPTAWSSDGRRSPGQCRADSMHDSSRAVNDRLPTQGQDVLEVRLQRLDDLDRPSPRVDARVPRLDLAAAVDYHADARRALRVVALARDRRRLPRTGSVGWRDPGDRRDLDEQVALEPAGNARTHSRRPSRTRPAPSACRKVRSPRHHPIRVRRSARRQSSSGKPGLVKQSDTSLCRSRR
mgnify:CR=1 FL=1